jgi:DNA-binding transcriptional regulator PaaX
MLKEIILEILKDSEWWPTDDVFLDLTSYKSLRRYVYYGGRPPQTKKEREIEHQKEERQRFYNLLYQLKKQGFVEKKSKGKNGFWKLTFRGLQYLKNLKHKKRQNPVAFLKPEDVIKKDYLKVIVFDIPEKKRKERRWLRQTLTNFNFSILQKSVWIGETQLPENFFHALKELDLLSYIHIFAVNKEKTGTLHL